MRFWKKPGRDKPDLFLGNITVASTKGFAKWISDEHSVEDRIDDDWISQAVLELVALPSLSQRQSYDDGDLAIDITVADYNRGALILLNLYALAFPLGWRPEIVMTARVYSIDTNETRVICTVKRKYRWRGWFRRLLDVGRYLHTGGSLDLEEMRNFVHEACIDLLLKVQAGMG